MRSQKRNLKSLTVHTQCEFYALAFSCFGSGHAHLPATATWSTLALVVTAMEAVILMLKNKRVKF